MMACRIRSASWPFFYLAITLLLLASSSGGTGIAQRDDELASKNKSSGILSDENVKSSRTFTSAVPDCSDKHSSRFDPLACWLLKMKVALPDQEFKKTFIKVHVRGLVCTNFTMNGLDSAYIPSQQHLDPSIDLAVKGVSAHCVGSYEVSPGYVAGNIHTTATSGGDENSGGDNDTAIGLTWEFSSSSPYKAATKYKLPVALNTTKCRADLEVSDLHFTGSISAHIINLFSGMIADSVTDQLNEKLCPILQKQIDPLFTHVLESVDEAISKLLPNTTTREFSSQHKNSSYYHEPADFLVQSTQILTSDHLPLAQSTSLDFEKDAPVLMTSLQSLNHFLSCFYASSDGINLAVNTQHNCSGLVTKALTGITSVVVDSLAHVVGIPLPSGAHKIQFTIPKYGKIKLDIQDLYIQGLDQLDHLSLLNPVSNEKKAAISTFQTKLQTSSGLNVTADVHITVLSIEGGVFKGDPLQETFHVNFNVSSLSAVGDLALKFAKKQFQYIQIGTVLDMLPFYREQHHSDANSTLEKECIVDSIRELQVADLALHTVLDAASFVPHLGSQASGLTSQRESTMLSKKLEEDLDGLLNHFLELLLQEYQPTVAASLTGLVAKPLLKTLNHWIDKKLKKYDGPSSNASAVDGRLLSLLDTKDKRCDSEEDNSGHRLANFSDVGLLHKLNRYLNKPSTMKSINHAIERLASSIEKRYNDWTLADPRVSLGSLLQRTEIPGVSVELQELSIENLGSLRHIDLLSPESDGMHLKNGFAFGVADTNIPTVHASVGLFYHPRNLKGVLNATVTLGDVHLDSGTILHLDMTRLRQLTLSRLFSHGHCVIFPFDEYHMYNHKNFSRVGVFLGNASASFTGNSHFNNFTAIMDTVEYPSAVSFVAALASWMMNTFQAGLNSAFHSSFEQAEGYCTGGQKFGYDDDPPVLDDGYKDEWLLPVFGMFSGMYFICQLVVVFFLRRPLNTQASVATSSYESASDMTGPLLPTERAESGSRDCDDDDKRGKESLLQSTAISAFTRHFVPVFIIGTIVLLFSSNVSSGATVDVYISLNQSRTVSLPSLFTFSLFNTAKDMWQAKIYPLFFLVLIMSGMWPYMKLVLMLLAWVIPSSVLSSGTRERLLLALDALGKFALVDTYLFVLMMVAFRYHLTLSDEVSVDAFVSPETGFYSFLVATCFSLVAGHILIFFHRRSESKHLIPRRESRFTGYRESVFEHKFLVSNNDNEEQRLKMSRRFKVFILLEIVLSILFLSIGITRKSFKFEIGGIAGDILGEKRVSYYSLLSLGSSLRKSVRDPSKGIVLLEVAYYFYAVVTPFACLGLLAVLLVCPMTLRTQRFFLTSAEIANAWGAIEVFVISIVASLLEISTFASFIIGDKCDLIDKILRDYFASAMTDASDATCFTVRSSIQGNAWFLVAGVLFNSFIVSLVLRFVHSSVAERIATEMEGIPAHPFNDGLVPSSNFYRHLTIADFLSRGCLRGFVFSDHGSALPENGYAPQSMDTLSVDPSVHWDDSMTHDCGEVYSPTIAQTDVSSNMETTNGVRETIRNAFD